MIQSGSAKLLALLTDPISDKIPKGFATAKEYAQRTGRSTQTMLIYLKKAEKEGLVYARKFYVTLESGKRLPIMHYRIKKGKATLRP